MLNPTRLLSLTASLLLSATAFAQAPPPDAPAPMGGGPSMERPFEPGARRARIFERLRERRDRGFLERRGAGRDRDQRSGFGGHRGMERQQGRRPEFGGRRDRGSFDRRGADRGHGQRPDFGGRRGKAHQRGQRAGLGGRRENRFESGTGRDQRPDFAQELRDLKARRHELKARIAELKAQRKGESSSPRGKRRSHRRNK